MLSLRSLPSTRHRYGCHVSHSRITKLVVGTLCTFALFNALLFASHRYYLPANDLLQFHDDRVADGNDRALTDIRNETLGFEKVFVIGLKERTDRHDYITLSASISGFKVEWIDGVRGENIPDKALPEGFKTSKLSPAHVGCWRAHMNALVKIVEERISTALIMEDDADWDVLIKSQLMEFARGVRALQKTPPNKQVSLPSPYGADWDLLWVGGCATGAGVHEKEFYVIPDDPTVPAVRHRGFFGGSGPLEEWKARYPEDTSRFIYRASMGCCLYGYAVTYEAARKILASLALDRLDEPVDNALSNMCAGSNNNNNDRALQLRCIAPFPNLIGMYRFAGSSQRDSDIMDGAADMEHGAEAWNLVYSVRMNLQRLLMGAQTALSQWNDEEKLNAEVKLEEVEYPRGHLVSA